MFATTADELLKVFRAEVSDEESPYLWKDPEAYGYMTEAFDALLKGTNTVQKNLRLPYLAGADSVPLPNSVTHIISAAVEGQGWITPLEADEGLTVCDYGKTYPGMSGALNTATGRVSGYIRDHRLKVLLLRPVPVADGALLLHVATTVGVAMGDGIPLPTTDSQDLRLALHYMKYLAYQKHDAETEDLQRSKTHFAYFDAGVVEREVALRNYRSPAVIVRPEY